ncbi:MAG TPA: hypothetical protein VLF68_04155 [Candidatus Saccharimonadales bacterium]|nr:hypothetical protein [Candidatus Saccharimonadales bacterium]
MTATGHALIGTAIAAKFGDPLLAIPIALVSHVIVDAIPHWDLFTHRREKTKQLLFVESVIDVLLGFALSYLMIKFLFPNTPLIYAFILIIAAQLLDWLTVPYLILNMKYPPFTWAYKFQKLFDNKLDKPWGIIDQAAILGIIIFAARML